MEAVRLNVFYGDFHAVHDVNLTFGKQRDHRAHRPVRLRQVHRAALPQPDERPGRRRPRRGRGDLPRPEHLRQGRRPDRGAHAHRHGLPEAEPVPEVDLRQHRLRPAGHRHEGRQHGRPGRAGPARRCPVGRGQGQAQAVGVRPVRRSAAAPVHRPHHRHPARRHPDGRALLGARPDRHRAHRGPDARAARGLHDHHRHPQHAAGGAGLRPDRLLHRQARRDHRQPHRPPRGVRPHHADLLQPPDSRTEDYISGRFG